METNNEFDITQKTWQLLKVKETKKGNSFNLIEKNWPGVYVIAWANENILGEKVNWDDIYYIGMSNAKAGVKGRLKQFWNGITKGTGHSGGNRWFNINGKYNNTNSNKKFYFAYILIEDCNVDKTERKPPDLRKMGEVAKLEYDLMAKYKEKTEKEPEGNKK